MRGLAVYQFLKEKEKLAEQKLVAHGFGAQPSKKSQGDLKKRFNRQVEIICDYHVKIPYDLRKKPVEKDILLDFKGFIFDLKEKPDGQGQK